MANYTNLRDANRARDIEWTGGAPIQDVTWRACELAGEVGEFAELFDVHGRATPKEVADEAADVLICCDLTALTLGISPDAVRPVELTLNGPYRDTANAMRLIALRLCNSLKKAERERRGWPGSRADRVAIAHDLQVLGSMARTMLWYHRVSADAAVVDKFNETSSKVGLTTKLRHGTGVV